MTELGTKIDPHTSDIRVDGTPLRPQPRRYVLLNKPRGYITTTSDERGRRTVMDLIASRERIYPVGRLDRDTEGLLLLTNDGDVAARVMHPRYELAKEYHVLTPLRPTAQTLDRIRTGIAIDGRRVVPDECRLLRETRDGLILTIVVHEGRYHVVRRLMDAAGIPVTTLARVRLGPLTITGLSLGGWRDLTPGERSTLFEALHLDASDTHRAANATRSGRLPTPPAVRRDDRRQNAAQRSPGTAARPAVASSPRDARMDHQQLPHRRTFNPPPEANVTMIDGAAEPSARSRKRDSTAPASRAARPARGGKQPHRREPLASKHA